jgi:signal transduction histidine kinase
LKESLPEYPNSSERVPERKAPLFSENDPSIFDRRTIIFAPTGRDKQLIADLLNGAGLPCHAVSSIAELCQNTQVGAGAAILSEEALKNNAIPEIVDALDQQPPWSDFPLILLTVSGRVTVESERLRELRQPLGNLFLLERPIRPETLLSTLEIALRGRQRQYQIRDQMLQYAKAQEALRRSEKLAVAGRLAASIAHEINNPLEAVTNLLYLIRTSPSPDTLYKYLDDAEQELARVTEITKQTLRFYREPHKPVATEVEGVLHSVLVLYTSRLAAANVIVEPEFRSPGLAVLSSPGELRQVIANIIGNSIDAMRSGGRLRIRISREKTCRLEGVQCVRLTIADQGAGIPPGLLPTIFEPFVTTKEETGTGLGLWVTKEIVRRNGWNIKVRSRRTPGHSGTVFSIQMPIAA